MSIPLPYPRIRRDVLSVEEALAYRRSIRRFRDEPLTIDQLSQLLWATYGVNDPRRGFRTTPSAGACYPIEVYVVIREKGVKNNDEFLEPGSYRYDPFKHALSIVKKGDLSKQLTRACLNQDFVGRAPVNIVLAAVYERTTRYYGERGYRYVYIDIGHAAQNLYLEATAIGLGCVGVGAFIDDDVKEIVGLRNGEHPVYILPVGVPLVEYRVSEQDIRRYIDEHRK